MSNKVDEIKFDEKFLVKYGGLFETSCLDAFYKNIKQLCQKINENIMA